MEGEQNIGGYGETFKKREFSEYDWFTKKTYQNELRKSTRKYLKPQSTDPYYWFIPKNPDNWTKFHNTKIWGTMRIQQLENDGTTTALDNTTATKKFWSVVNNVYHSLWSSVVVKANGCDFEDTAANMYHWKSYIQTLLNISPSYKKAKMEHNAAWIPDEPAKGNIFKELDITAKTKKVGNVGEANYKAEGLPGSAANSGFILRNQAFADGAKNAFEINIYHDIMTSGKCFPPQTEFEIYLHRNSDNFSIITSDDCTQKFKIILEDVHLSYDLQTVTKEVAAYHNARKTNSAPKATIKKNFMKYYVCPQGASDMHRYNFFYSSHGQLPEQIILFFIPQNKFLGKPTENSYDWPQDIEFEEIGLYVNGHQEPEGKFLSTVGAIEKQRLYEHFLDNTGYGDADKTGVEIPVSYREFFGNAFMIPFDRTAANHGGYYDTQPDSGSIDIHLKLAATNTLKTNTVVCVYASYSEDMFLDESNVYFKSIESATAGG